MNESDAQIEEFSNKPDAPVSDDVEGRLSIVQASSSSSWSGPIPPPSALERYETVLPGSADRILKMAERAQENRHELNRTSLETERLVVSGDSKRSYLGVVSALLISLICIVGGIYLTVAGQAWAGVALVGFDLAGLVAVFIYGTNSRRTDFNDIVEKTEEG